MSKTIFLEPVSQKQKTVYVDIKNTSAQSAFNLAPAIKEAVRNQGYQVVEDPKAAHFWLQANVRYFEKANLNQCNSILDSGFGGGAMGALTAGALGGNGKTIAQVGLAGAVVGIAADALVKDNMYTLVTDVQISERLPKGSAATKTDKAYLQQGSGSQQQVQSTEQVPFRRYQTRVVSYANRINLKFPEAAPALISAQSQSIAGLF